MCDLFISAAEPSADLHGSNLITELTRQNPQLKIAAVAGPKMRKLPIEAPFAMESLQVMGFIDVALALPKLIKQFYAIRNAILKLNPKAVVLIDYPGFHLRLERSLRKKGYRGKLIHYICPTVWAWGKKRIPLMAKQLDLLLTFFPFEKQSFQNTPLKVEYVGHPLLQKIKTEKPHADFREKHRISPEQKILALFPGSRETEIKRNFSKQLETAKKLLDLDPSLCLAVSIAHSGHVDLIQKIAACIPILFIEPEENYDLMREAHLALATSGTVTLELALHRVPTIVNFAIKPLDVFIAQKILAIDLPYYCIVNILLSKMVFPELFGPNLTSERFFHAASKFWFDNEAREECIQCCDRAREVLGESRASELAASSILRELTSA